MPTPTWEELAARWTILAAECFARGQLARATYLYRRAHEARREAEFRELADLCDDIAEEFR